ncbi:MAG: hypothetical protein IJA54_00285 [Tyzzerella sp.]|nr:hypothetical protein [Tyzzerella sp.]
MKIINDYLDNVLYKQLREINMPYRFIKQIQEDIKLRMLSCLAYWTDIESRNTILFLSLEEALFYEPSTVQKYLREFVVTTIRNSMIEVAASDDFRIFKISEPLSNEQVKQITFEAIQYFNNYDMNKLANDVIGIENEQNVYSMAKKKFPLAWDVLHQIANLDGYKMKIEKTEQFHREKLELKYGAELKTVVCNGFTLEFDETLKGILGDIIADKNNCFYSDCFKMVSRNFEKVLHVLQIILENDKVFCTSNYYISCNYIEKRKKILRAAHNSQDAIKNMNCDGAPNVIRECIDTMMGGN